MNIKSIKEQFTLRGILSNLGHEPVKEKSRGHDLWYHSPFRPNERTPSFHIDERKDIWMDFGLAASKNGGDLIFFVQTYLREQGQSYSVKDAITWFRRLNGIGPTLTTVLKRTPKPRTSPPKFKIIKVQPIKAKALIDYLAIRKIDPKIANIYLKEVHFEHAITSKRIFGLGLKNESGGYEIRNPLGFKGSVGVKDISFIKAKVKSDSVSIFEGCFDFLSFKTLLNQNRREFVATDCIILNSTGLYLRAFKYVHSYNSVNLWLDNDKSGLQAMSAIEKRLNQTNSPKVLDKTSFYRKHTDLNQWLCSVQPLQPD